MIGIYGGNNSGFKFLFLPFLCKFLLQIGMLKVSKYSFNYCLIFVTGVRFTNIQHSLGLILMLFNLITHNIPKIDFYKTFFGLLL